MASIKKIHKNNIEGDFYVDTTCINCDTCRQLAPNIFMDSGSYSAVYRQPNNSESQINALLALVACPSGSIGTKNRYSLKEIKSKFPLLLEKNVYFCGFNSTKSFGANSYFIQHTDGNWLIDSPRYSSFLVDQFKKLGGIKYIFLTHRDDVADARKYANIFSSQRMIHKYESSAQPNAEIIIDGINPIEFKPEFLIIPTPGHTKGHCVLLYKNQYLFTGDHLYFKRSLGHLNAFRNACWYSWTEQTKSMKNLLNYKFEWILPGHGQRIRLNKDEIIAELLALVDRMDEE